jgi:uncharacterized RmlC-like cupin family protein
VVWAIDFQFDSTVDGKAIKIAPMIDEHTRVSLLHLVERSITAECLVAELETVFTSAGGPPKVLRMDNGPELVSAALQRFCEHKVGLSYIPAGEPWTTATSNRSTTGCAGSASTATIGTACSKPGWSSATPNTSTTTAPFSPGLPNTGRVRRGVQAHPHPGALRDQLNPERRQPDWKSSGARVVPGDQLDTNTPQANGLDRAAAVTFARAGAQKLWAGTAKIQPGANTGAHHHGDLETVVYMLRGRARMRWGEALEFAAEAGSGDFIYIPMSRTRKSTPPQMRNWTSPLSAAVVRRRWSISISNRPNALKRSSGSTRSTAPRDGSSDRVGRVTVARRAATRS